MAVKELTLPKGFREGSRRKVSTVAKLIAELQQLPPTMRVVGDFNFGVRVTVVGYNNKCLAVTFDSE